MTDNVVQPHSCFVDSNVWLYAFNRRQDEAKHQIAKAIVAEPDLLVSTQVINEVCKNLLQKASFSEAQISKVITAFYKRCRVTHLSKEILLQASVLRTRYQLSFWDSLICAAALNTGAIILYSEDMHDGLNIENRLTVTNPFSQT
ncbi:PIN domain-containing protein [Nodosilinea sp. LEGE 07298]|uniref:PIN domain-containing protein n=1 Tax=Nodosilinea sp. LEGE 07298 TaxID=2777970 RepID=UPI0018829CB0|nr:PIN domain-containing protein [Nodosilinea sp. LEGE 07298]MBE9110866.1 PIN domain-containing protein [Nodosilinea sp. LEGE 07298]